MRPEQVIDCQADIYQRLTRSGFFTAYIEEVLRQSQLDGGLSAEDRERNVVGIRNLLTRSINLGCAYRVTADMSMLVQHAASTLDETDRFIIDLPPSEHGLVYFERPLPISDARGRPMLAHWLVWGKGVAETRGTAATGTEPMMGSYWFNDHLVGPDEIAREIWSTTRPRHETMAVTGRWGFIGADLTTNGVRVGPPMEEMDDLSRARILADGATPTEFTNTRRYLLALWMLLGQSVSVAEDEYVRKTSFRRAQRLGIQPRVTVIRLRRTDGSRHEGESLIDWSHRWLVRGHPRWQPYGERSNVDHEHVYGDVEAQRGHSVRVCGIAGCDARLERIWIAPYVKGPEDKPIRFTEHVYDLAR